MSTRAVNELERFVRAQLARTGTDRLAFLDARHSHGAGSDRVNLYEIPNPIEAVDQFVADTCKEIQTDIQDHANALGDMQEYRLLALNDAKQCLAQRAFRIRGETADDGFATGSTGHRTETPDSRGVLAMAMRLAETGFRLGLEAANNANLRLMEENANLRMTMLSVDKVRADTEDRHYKVVGVMEGLLSRQLERDLLIKAQNRKEERREKMLEKGMKFLPMLAGQIPGAEKILGAMGSDDALTEIVKEMTADSEKTEALLAMIGALPISPGPKRKLLAQIEKIIEAAAKERAKAKQTENASADTAH